MKDMYREALWQKRGRPRELYPDISSKDAPVSSKEANYYKRTGDKCDAG